MIRINIVRLKASYFLSLTLLQIAISTFANGSIPFEGHHPPVEFRVLDSHSIELTNTHRANGKFKFSLRGVSMTKVVAKNQDLWHIKLNDGQSVRYTVASENVTFHATRHTFHWNNTNGHGHAHEVCFDFAFNSATWYQTFLEPAQPYPMGRMKPIAKPVPVITGSKADSHFGPIIEYVFFSTDGIALSIDPYKPLFLRRDSSQICISINGHEHPYRFYAEEQNSEISFAIVTARDIRQVYTATTKWAYLMNVPTYSIPDPRMFTHPSWSLAGQYHNGSNEAINQERVLRLGKAIKDHGFGPSQVVIDTKWESHYGDLQFDANKFPNPKAMTTTLHHEGHLVKLPVHSFVSSDSKLWKEHPIYLLKDNSTGKPLSIRLFNETGALLDYSDPYGFDRYLYSHLKLNLNETLGVDSFRFDGGELDLFAMNNYRFSILGVSSRRDPNDFTASVFLSAFHYGKMVEAEADFRNQHVSVFVRMKDIEPSWNGLTSMMKTALTMAIAGYSFMIPATFKAHHDKPSAELYIRWVQACAFLPAMQFSIAPWQYNETVVNITRKYVNLHREHVPIILDIASNQTVATGYPLIQPMWYHSPNDSRAYNISDQFMLGNDIVVAPVLRQGQLERTVYLPQGDWIDQHGKAYSGPAMVQMLTPIEELAYFKRKH